MPSPTVYARPFITAGNLIDNIPTHAVAITPSDSVNLDVVPAFANIGLVAATAGNIAVQLFGGGTATLTVLANVPVLIGASRVLATGTTATGLQSIMTQT
ncbi:hypothetical protein BH09PSE6_BH09PSE6_07210 [soil metagenome]